jgi:hypothetical protein
VLDKHIFINAIYEQLCGVLYNFSMINNKKIDENNGKVSQRLQKKKSNGIKYIKKQRG